MLKKYLSKFTIEILPSVFATVVGAYIVNYYIIPKAREDRPPAAAAALSNPKTPDIGAAKASDAKSSEAKPADAAAETADAPEAASTPARKPADKPVEKAASETKPDKAEASKNAEKNAESRRHTPVREKAAAKTDKAEPPAAAPAPTPVLATVGTAPATDERRDANDLARAAIERLNRSEPKTTQDASRLLERTASAQPAVAPQQPVQQAQPMQQLPPPIVVANPTLENVTPTAEQSRRLRPPGDVPVPLRGDMQANAGERNGRTNVVEDVLSGAKSMFDKVIPRPFER
jgi:hypothetical protein